MEWRELTPEQYTSIADRTVEDLLIGSEAWVAPQAIFYYPAERSFRVFLEARALPYPTPDHTVRLSRLGHDAYIAFVPYRETHNIIIALSANLSAPVRVMVDGP